MSLRTRVIAMATIALLALGIAGVLVGRSFFEARRAGTEATGKLQNAATSADALVVAIGQMDRGLLQYVGTTKGVSLSPYAEGLKQSDQSIGDLKKELEGTDDSLLGLVNDVAAARTEWNGGTAKPAIAAVRHGRQQDATELVQSKASVESYAILEARATDLQAKINVKRREVFDTMLDFTQQLAIALVGSGAAFLIGLIAAIVLVNRWVIKPLDRLRGQLREVAREGLHEAPIIPSGPPELTAAGQDAEEMRRQLVAEIDEARMAREGLEQEGPVVAAIRAELSRPQVGYAPGLEIFGDLQPAEGVLAGDWWEVLPLADGRTAIMTTDVSGHGPAAGIAGLRAKLTLTSVLDTGGSAAEAMKRGARLFAETPSRFATCVIVVLDPRGRRVEWVNAGHPPPVILNASGQLRELQLTGPLLSALGGTWGSRTAQLADDEVLVIWTDGVSESRDAEGDQLEEEGLVEMISSARELGAIAPRQLVPAVLARARNRAIDWRRDDVTLIAARFTPRG